MYVKSFMLTGLQSKRDFYAVYSHIMRVAEMHRSSAKPGTQSAKRKALTRENRQMATRARKRDAAGKNGSGSNKRTSASRDNDNDDDDDAAPTTASAVTTESLTKAQKKEILRRVKVCIKGVRDVATIQRMQREVITAYHAEIKSAAASSTGGASRKRGRTLAGAAAASNELDQVLDEVDALT
jgi:hypothetical protein